MSTFMSAVLTPAASTVVGLWHVTQYSTSVRPPPWKASWVSLVAPWQVLQVAVWTMSRVSVVDPVAQLVVGPLVLASKSHQAFSAGRSEAESWIAA